MNISLNKKSYKIKDLKRIKNNNGDILHYVKKNWKSIPNIQEIYFSYVKKNKVKGWIKHKKNICLLSAPLGKVSVEVKKDNENIVNKIKLDSNNPKLLIIYPNTWYAIINSGNCDALIVNAMNGLHKKSEYKKKIYNK